MNLAILPLLLPLLTALTAPFLGRRLRARRWLVGSSTLLQCVVHVVLGVRVGTQGSLVLAAGGWDAPVGITLVVDPLAVVMLVLTSLTILLALGHSFTTTPAAREHPLRLPLLQLFLAGVNLCFITADLFNFFVALELLLISSYALLTLEADHRTVRAALPYVTVNILGGIILLGGTVIGYALFGTLNYADLARHATARVGDPRVTAWVVVMLVALGTKTALVPLFFWLPNSYPVLPPALGAIFAATLTKVGAYAFIRIFVSIVPEEIPIVFPLLRTLAAVTILVGTLGALGRHSLRAIFSFLLIGQLGFVVLALGLATPPATTAAIFHLMHEIPAIASLFLFAATVAALRRTDGPSPGTRALWHRAPWFSAAFLCQTLSFAGIPPLSGFWGKFMMIDVATAQGAGGLVACMLAGSLLTLVALLRVWLREFWAEPPDRPTQATRIPIRPVTWAAGALTLVSLTLGLGAEGAWRLAEAANTALRDRASHPALLRPSDAVFEATP